MACSLPHTDSEVEALVQKLIDEDKGRQNAILDLALQFENSCNAKDDLRKAYEKGRQNVSVNKKDKRGVVVRNKARLVSQGHRQEEGIDYDEVFAPVARIEATRIFLAFASFIGFIVNQMDAKSAFLYHTIDEEVYVTQPLGFIDPKYPKKVYKVVKAQYGLHQAPRAWYATLFTFLLKNGYRRGTIDKTLFIKKEKKDIMPDKYVAEILKKFDFISVKTASTPIETQKPLIEDEEAADVDVHLYRSMIGSLMYLTASRPNIMFAVYACSRFQVTPKTSHLQAVKRIFSDYAGANLDRKFTIGEAEYVTVANCCGQVLWIQNQMLDYGFNFMNANIYIDNESTICIVKNPVFHSKTKHIAIRHHFIGDAYEKKLIQVLKIHTDDNVANLLTKAFDVSRLGKKMQFGLVLGALNASMANLEFVAQHNMVACLEKTEGNFEFHEIVDFLTSSMIHHALTRVKVQEHPLNPNLHPLLLTLVQETNPLYSHMVLALENVKDAQAAEIIALKARIKKLEKKCKPSISHHRAWLKSVQRLSMKKRFRKKECVSKQGRKKDKPEPTLDDSTFDGLDADHGMDYIDTEEPVNEGRLSEKTKELKLTTDTEEIAQDKGSGEKGGSAEELVSTTRLEDSVVRSDVGTADLIAPPTTTTSIFNDEDITMAQTLIKMKEEKAKEKGVSIKDIEDSSRPARSILTLKLLPTIDPKDKGKGVLEEPEPAKKMTRSDLDAAQIAKDAQVARLGYEEELVQSWKGKKRKDKGKKKHLRLL
uniref:Reverse transcriptase Ty1/copia-type domain-containing protein n=1 Tax=Tanacetum cinerariifolium TaxID=118510 RepID=A0A6L2L0Q7_TANCI|nr:hypothetical protein [Tanacetum cinerariifolium]